MTTDERPESAAFDHADRFSATKERTPARVLLDGVEHPGAVIAFNGPRVQVSVQIDGQTYTRWVDRESVLV